MTNLSANDWENRYKNNDTPWDLSTPTPEFVRLAADGFFPKKGVALVPGGGRGHDAILLAKSGLEVDIVDFAPSALEALLAQSLSERVPVAAFRRDFFELSSEGFHQNRYDVLLEYTFFCAIDPALREKYALHAARMLKPRGKIVGLFFPLSSDKAPPPFPVTRAEIEKVFAPYFAVELLEPRASVGPRAGRELLGIFTKR